MGDYVLYGRRRGEAAKGGQYDKRKQNNLGYKSSLNFSFISFSGVLYPLMISLSIPLSPLSGVSCPLMVCLLTNMDTLPCLLSGISGSTPVILLDWLGLMWTMGHLCISCNRCASWGGHTNEQLDLINTSSPPIRPSP